MIDFCDCCNGCSSRRQLSTYPRYRYTKKLLVAISVVVIIAMCLMPTEARTLEHKKRHKRPENMAHPTKEASIRTEAREHKRRHQKMLENLTQPTKEPRRAKGQAEIYNRETRKIVKKLKNTRRFFNEDRKQLDEVRDYREAMPIWLPTVNFVEIHYHDYRSNRARKNGTTIPERKYLYLMPKLYKSLVEYHQIFKHLINVDLNFSDNPYNTHKKKRKAILQNILDKLYSTIQEVNDSISTLNVSLPPSSKNKLDLSSLPKRVDSTQCIKYDYLAFRGYWNLLNNWYLEFRCPKKGGKQAAKKICQAHEAKLEERINNRRKDNRINSVLVNRVRSRT